MKDTTAAYQRLQTLILEKGCPVCHLSQEVATTYLDTILWESSTDLNVHNMLTASIGFCGRHSRALLDFGGQRLAAAVVERASLLAAIHRLPDLTAAAVQAPASQFRLWPARQGDTTEASAGARPAMPGGIQPCPACVREITEENRAIQVLLAHMGEFSAPLLEAGGLCLPHFLQTMRRAHERERAVLSSIQQEAWAGLSSDLEQFIRKQMHHHQSDPISEPARHAVERTIDALTGTFPVR